jgi:hypothetical protein
MNHDPEVYGADAEEYRPTRYLDPEGNFLPAIADTKDEGHLTYGFGRRSVEFCMNLGLYSLLYFPHPESVPAAMLQTITCSFLLHPCYGPLRYLPARMLLETLLYLILMIFSIRARVSSCKCLQVFHTSLEYHSLFNKAVQRFSL